MLADGAAASKGIAERGALKVVVEPVLPGGTAEKASSERDGVQPVRRAPAVHDRAHKASSGVASGACDEPGKRLGGKGGGPGGPQGARGAAEKGVGSSGGMEGPAERGSDGALHDDASGGLCPRHGCRLAQGQTGPLAGEGVLQLEDNGINGPLILPHLTAEGSAD